MNGILAISGNGELSVRGVGQYIDLPIWRKQESLPSSAGTVIRWGTTRKAPSAAVTINVAEAIKLTSNKPRCRYVLQQAHVPVPALGSRSLPCIGRKKNHSAGRDVWLCRTRKDVLKARREGAVYFSAFYPKQSEYRLHVAGGRVILYSRKVGGETKHVTWNHANGSFIFRHIVKQYTWRPELVSLAIKAIETVGLDFGAVDIMADPEVPYLPKAVVCEINTAPALSPYAVKVYARYFRELL